MYSRNTGTGGTYEYFVCPRTQRGECEQGWNRVDRVAAEIEGVYRTVGLTDAQREVTRAALRDHLGRLADASETEIKRCNTLVAGLKGRERKLLRAHFEDGISSELFKEELAQLQREREGAEGVLERLSVRHEDIQDTLDVGLSILGEDIGQLYLQSDDTIRRIINQAIFEALYICDDDIVGTQFKPEVAQIQSIAIALEAASGVYADALGLDPGQADRQAPTAVLAALAAADAGEETDKAPDSWAESGANVLSSIRTQMVARPGLEPGTPRFSVVCSTN